VTATVGQESKVYFVHVLTNFRVTIRSLCIYDFYLHKFAFTSHTFREVQLDNCHHNVALTVRVESTV
jgi:hypothetical protein